MIYNLIIYSYCVSKYFLFKLAVYVLFFILTKWRIDFVIQHFRILS